MELWHPRAIRVEPSPRFGGAFVDGYAPRQLLHTTEGGPDYSPSRSSFYGNPFWPHAVTGRVANRARIVQHLPINVSAGAAENRSGGVETNRAHAIQLEIAWWANQIEALPEDIAEVTEDWVRWVAEQAGTKLEGPQFFGTDCGWTLASATARQRMSAAAWRSFNGVCGHQHVPENVHWDPGALDLSKVIDLKPLPTPAPAPSPVQEDDVANLIEVPWLTGFPRPSWKVSKGPIDGSSFSLVSFNGAPLDAAPVLRGGKMTAGGKFSPGQKDDKGRVIDVVAFGLWIRQVYDTAGNADGFVHLDGGAVGVQCGLGAQYTIGRPPA